MIVAVIPAAGASSRMGRPKLTLPFRDGTILDATVAALKSAADEVLIVARPGVTYETAATVLTLPEVTPDMRSTVLAGLEFVEHAWPKTRAILLAPADHPCLSVEVVRSVVAAGIDERIVIPTFAGRRGHPAFIPWCHVEGLRALPSNVGLNTYFRADPDRVRELPVNDPHILTDIDTPDDYRRLTNGAKPGAI